MGGLYNDDYGHQRCLNVVYTYDGAQSKLYVDCSLKKTVASLPLRLIISLIKNGHVQGNVFWDLLGLAEYVYVRKK